MKKLLGFFIALILLLGIGFPALAQTWSWYTQIFTNEFEGASHNGSGIVVDFDVQNYVDLGYLDPGGLNSRMWEAEVDRAQAMSESRLGFGLPELLSYQAKEFNWYTGYSPNITGLQIVPGWDGYVTAPDDPTLENTDNWSWVLNGWINTDNGTDKNLINKDGSFSTFISENVSENITARLISSTNTTAYMIPNAAGSYTNIAALVGAPTHWQAVDDPVGFPDEDATYVANINSIIEEKDAYNLEDISIPEGSEITSVNVTFRFRPTAAANAYARPYLRLNGVESNGLTVTLGVAAYATYSESLVRPGGGAWEAEDLEDLQVAMGLWIQAATGYDCRLTQVYVVVDYFPSIQVSVLDVDSEEHEVKATGSAAFLGLGIDIGEGTGFPFSDNNSVSDNMVLNTPLWSSYLSGGAFDSVDDEGIACTVHGATYETYGRSFDGNDYVEVTYSDNISLLTQGTIVVWFRGDPAARSTYASSDSTLVAQNELYIHRNGNRIAWRTENAGVRQDLQTIADNTYVPGDWHFVAFMSTGIKMTCNINGVAQAITAAGNNGDFFGDMHQMDNFSIGSLRRPAPTYYTGDVGEVQIYSEPLTHPELLDLYNTTKWKYLGSYTGDSFDYVYSGGSILDNLNDWNFMGGNSVPWADNITFSVNGTQQLYYSPDDIISGITLPDRSGVGNTGNITWGGRFAYDGSTTQLTGLDLVQADDYWNGFTLHVKETGDGLAPQGETANVTGFDQASGNLTFDVLTQTIEFGDRYELWRTDSIISWGAWPFGIEIRMGAIVAFASATSAAIVSEEPQVLVAPQESSSMWGGAAAATLPMFGLVTAAATPLGWTAQTLYVVLTIIVGVLMGVAVLIMTGSVLGAVAMAGCAMFIGVAMGILPLWFILVFGIMGITMLYSFRHA